jgi:hypothetical protein
MGLFWYVFIGFAVYYAYVYYTTRSIDPQQWNIIYILLGVGFLGWIIF